MNSKKRAELHMHTKMSQDVSVIAPSDIFTLAFQKNLSAVAVTDLNSVHSFAEITKLHKQQGVNAPKIIYGCEVGCLCVENSKPSRMTLLVKNQEGIKELYKIISSSSDIDAQQYESLTAVVDLSVLQSNRSNLLCGSCGCYGELFDAILRGAEDAEVERVALQYDYLELFLTDSYQDKAIYKKIYDIGKKLGIPVVASSNCCYNYPDEAIAKSIVDGTPLGLSKEGCRYLCSAQEMSDEFSYLGEEAANEVVFDNPEYLVSMIDSVQPMEEEFHPFSLPDAYENIIRCCYETAEEIYGAPLPQQIADRLETELSFIRKKNTASYFELARRVRVYLQTQGYDIGVSGLVGASFVSFLIGITDCNPLPPHYVCKECHYTTFATDELIDGFNLPQKACPHCQSQMRTDGHNIPCEGFFGFDGDKLPYFDLNIPTSMWKNAKTFVRDLFGEDRVAYAGMVFTINTKTAQDMVSVAKSRSKRWWSGDTARYEALIAGVYSRKGSQLYGLIILPEEKEFCDFTPIHQVKDSLLPIRQVTHVDYRSLHNTLREVSFSGSTVLEVLKLLEEYTGISKATVPLNDPDVYTLFSNADTFGVKSFENDFMKDVLRKTKPRSFSDLVQIMGLSFGSGTWTANGEQLLNNGHTLSELPALRNDVFLKLLQAGIDRKKAFEISEYVCKGRFSHNSETTAEYVQLMKDADIPQWYIQALRKIRYMFPKAHAVKYVINAVRLAWYKLHYPVEFYAAYLSDYLPGDNKMTEDDIVLFKKVVAECLSKGIKLLDCDAEKSHFKKYLPENGNIRMPLYSDV